MAVGSQLRRTCCPPFSAKAPFNTCYILLATPSVRTAGAAPPHPSLRLPRIPTPPHPTLPGPRRVRSKLMRIHAAVAGRHARHGQLLPLEVYLDEGLPLVGLFLPPVLLVLLYTLCWWRQLVRVALASPSLRRQCAPSMRGCCWLLDRTFGFPKRPRRICAATPCLKCLHWTNANAFPLSAPCTSAGASRARLSLCHALRAVRAKHARLCVLWHRGLLPALPQGKSAAVPSGLCMPRTVSPGLL